MTLGNARHILFYPKVENVVVRSSNRSERPLAATAGRLCVPLMVGPTKHSLIRSCYVFRFSNAIMLATKQSNIALRPIIMGDREPWSSAGDVEGSVDRLFSRPVVARLHETKSPV